ncbi:hypothetical protein F4083_08095 [Candidatus Poribacteria bacterium]|nr:hypothetical protein [Candidatus Poribacteria bacterium]MYF56181.1 hypothetical protein [Candidatus Poribacteria bacterium]MYI94270.1 hypothetical protein [Candidatus Poribacteria bacterium]
MRKRYIISTILTAMIIIVGNCVAGTVQDFGKWEKGELLLENYSFEDDLTAWELEDGSCCDRGGLYTMEIDEDNPQHGDQCLKIVGVQATGTNWHAKIKQLNVSMEGGKEYTVIFWARAEKPRQVSLSVQMQHDPWTTWRSADIDLLGDEWMEYSHTFTAGADVDKDMWVGLSIAQSDVDFWLDNFRFFEGQPDDEIPLDGEPQSVDAKQKLTTEWASVKSERF